MTNRAYLQHWPPAMPGSLTLPATNVFFNAEVSAARYPDKPFIVFYDSVLTIADGVATKKPLTSLPFEKRRAARKWLAPVVRADWDEVDILDVTVRNEGGFGSTGR